MPFARELLVSMTSDSDTRESLLADDVLDLVIEYAIHHARHPMASDGSITIPMTNALGSRATSATSVRPSGSTIPNSPEVAKNQVQAAALRLLTEVHQTHWSLL
jgi:hypothetical protein